MPPADGGVGDAGGSVTADGGVGDAGGSVTADGGALEGGTVDGGGADASSGCTLGAATTPTAKVTGGCAALARDTSACAAQRASQGLSGAWLKLSCRVTLTKMATYVLAESDSMPDYKSNYFPAGDACYEAYTTTFPDPNKIVAQKVALKIPLTPTTAGQAMGLGPVGMAINGVAIFDNQAAPGDDIYKESGSFDRCQGHPARGGAYHYHSEPFAISSDDANLIGVLRDGYFVYGRRDADASLPTLDGHGGHTGTTSDSPGPVYHYHVNVQTSTTPGTAGQTVGFLTTGTYEGSPLP